MIVYDKQSNQAAPVITDILAADDFNALNNLQNSDRFITLANVITEPISLQNNFSVSGKINTKMSLETIWDDTAGATIASIHTGSIYVFFAQNSGVAVAAPLIISRSRIRFTDV